MPRRLIVPFWRCGITPALPYDHRRRLRSCSPALAASPLLWPLPGIWNGAPKARNVAPALLIDLAAVPLEVAPVRGSRWHALAIQRAKAGRSPGPPLERLAPRCCWANRARQPRKASTSPGQLVAVLEASGQWPQADARTCPAPPARPDRWRQPCTSVGRCRPDPGRLKQAPLVPWSPDGSRKIRSPSPLPSPAAAVATREFWITQPPQPEQPLADALGCPGR